MNLIDKYIIKQFVFTLAFAIVALCSIFLVVNLMESLDDFLDNDVSVAVIIEYYLNYFPEIIKILAPVATLLATLFTIGRLSTQNEIVAMKSGGMSLYRIMIPLVFISLLISVAHLYFNGWIVPDSSEKKIEIQQVYLKKNKSGGPIYNLYFRDSPQKNVTLNYYNSEKKIGKEVAIEYFSDNLNPRLIRRVEADSLKWDDEKEIWMMVNGLERTFNGNEIDVDVFDVRQADLNIKHRQIVRIKKSIEEMTLDEFREHIETLKSGGKDVRKQMIQYYGEYAFPFANFIVVLFGVPFASVRKKGGIAVQIGAAMVISFTYLIFIQFSETIGYIINIEPWIAAWFSNMFFLVLGVITIFNTKT
jgi:lipopolysaccharide export system permease protein